MQIDREAINRQIAMYENVRQTWCDPQKALIWQTDGEAHDDVNISVIVPIHSSFCVAKNDLQYLKQTCESAEEDHRWRREDDWYLTLNALPRVSSNVDLEKDEFWSNALSKISELCFTVAPFALKIKGLNILSDALIGQIFSLDDQLHTLHNKIFNAGIGSRRAEYEGPLRPNGYIPHLKLANIRQCPIVLASEINSSYYSQLYLGEVMVDRVEIRRRVRTNKATDYTVLKNCLLGN